MAHDDDADDDFDREVHDAAILDSWSNSEGDNITNVLALADLWDK